MKYTIDLKELVSRTKVRNDNCYDFYNKMTDEEIKQFEIEVKNNLLDDGVKKVFPDWNVAYMSKIIDTDILYNLIKLGKI